MLAAALEHEKDSRGPHHIGRGSGVAGSLIGSGRGSEIYGQAARSLANTLGRETDDWETEDYARAKMVAGLKSIAARMAPADAATILASALKKGTISSSRTELARVLSGTVDQLEDAEANRLADEFIASLDRDSLDSIAPELLSQLEAGRAHALAWDLASRMCSEPQIDRDALSRILTDTSREQRARRAARMALAGPGPEGMLEAAMRVSADPFPCRLTTQELVELLKMPTCFGNARRIVLDHLGNRYSRHFVNHWAFVRFATEQKLGLDFTTPPKRPDGMGSPKRTRARN